MPNGVYNDSHWRCGRTPILGLALFCTLHTSACLSLNADFAETPSVGANSSTDPHSGWEESTDAFEPEQNGSGGHWDKQSKTDNGDSSPMTSSVPANTGQSDTTQSHNPSIVSDSSNQVTTVSESSSESESSNSTTGTQSAEPDMSQGRWIPLEVSHSASENLPRGYALNLRFDHQSLVTNGAATDGSDVVLVSMHSGSIEVLDRVLDPASAWNRSDSQIWFAADASIPSGDRVRDHYYLVVGHPLLTRKEDPSQVYPFFDDFQGSTLDTNKWSVSQSSMGTPTYQVSRGKLRLDVPVASGDSSWLHVMANYPHMQGNLFLEAQVQARPHLDDSDCTQEHILMLRSSGDDKIRANFQQYRGHYAFVSYRDGLGSNLLQNINGPSQSEAALHYAIQWRGNTINLLRDQNSIFSGESQGTIQRPEQSTFRAGFELSSVDVSKCAGRSAHLEVDWVRARDQLLPEPEVHIAN